MMLVTLYRLANWVLIVERESEFSKATDIYVLNVISGGRVGACRVVHR
jgi:hypothetical protein